jgi:beta-lactam-binding protein with PASTA domain
VLLAALLVAVLILTFTMVRAYLEVEEIVLPDTVGMDVELAYRELRRLNLQVVSYPEAVVGVPANTVTSQVPAPGVAVRRGRSVSLGVSSPSEGARVPLLVGEREEDAVRRLGELGVALEQVSYAYSDQPAGQVVSQEPAAGTALGQGERVRLVVSRGPEVREVALPDVRGLSVRAAREKLEQAGFRRVELMPTGTSFSRANVVNEQSPSPGQRLPVTAPVSLYYALPSSQVVRVPDMRGQSLQRAQLMLRAAGLELGWVSYQEDPAQPSGVIDYRPEGYTLPGTPVVVIVNGAATGENVPLALEPLDRGERDVAAGDRVRLSERFLPGGAREPEDGGGRRLAFRFDPIAYGLPQDQVYEFRLDIDDAAGERTALERTLRAGDTIDTTIEVFDDAVLQIYINGELFSAWSP